MRFPRRTIFVAAICLVPGAAGAATKPKLDPDTCNSLRLEQIKFRQSGIVDDMSKGAAWGKANLSADRLREIQHYLDLDEQVQFGCRDAKLSAEAKRASEAAARIELNSDADPTAPVAKDPPKPGAAADKDSKPKKTVKKKTKSKSVKKAPKDKESNADDAQPQPGVAQSQPETNSAAPAAETSSFAGATASRPALGFGGGEALPWTSP